MAQDPRFRGESPLWQRVNAIHAHDSHADAGSQHFAPSRGYPALRGQRGLPFGRLRRRSRWRVTCGHKWVQANMCPAPSTSAGRPTRAMIASHCASHALPPNSEALRDASASRQVTCFGDKHGGPASSTPDLGRRLAETAVRTSNPGIHRRRDRLGRRRRRASCSVSCARNGSSHPACAPSPLDARRVGLDDRFVSEREQDARQSSRAFRPGGAHERVCARVRLQHRQSIARADESDRPGRVRIAF